jgi:adenylate kinase family enzyme
LKRVMMYRKGGRADMAEGCDEKFSLEFMRWIWTYPKQRRPKILKLLAEKARDKRVVVLRTQAEIEGFLTACRASFD